ncbi:MAG: ATP-binding cassette domain-containing protein [Gemmatimonadales bacterium]
MPPGDPVVVLTDVARRLGHRWVLSDVSLTVRRGEALMLLGGNGVGKTTLLRVIAGLLKPTRGTVQRRSAVGLVGHETMMYSALTGRENLRFFARMYGVADGARVDDALELLGLARFGDERIQTYSRGMLQRLSIARALLHDPGLLLLDEPLSNLDDAGSELLLTLVEQRVAAGCALVMATHQLGELVRCASHVAYLAKGRVAAMEELDGRDAKSVIERYRELTRVG